MFRYAKNVRLVSFLQQAFQMDNCDSHSGSKSLRLSLALSGSYWISPCLSLALYGSLWLPLWHSLALTATLWHTLAHYCSLILRIQSFIGSQNPLSAAATLTHFLPLWTEACGVKIILTMLWLTTHFLFGSFPDIQYKEVSIFCESNMQEVNYIRPFSIGTCFCRSSGERLCVGWV